MAPTVEYGSYLVETHRADQAKYRLAMRESDRVLIAMTGMALRDSASDDPCAVDIGCSSGNLLYHLKQTLPDVRLRGGDLYADVVAHCAADPDLAGVDFEVMDLLDLDLGTTVDVAIVNAVLCLLDHDAFETAVINMARHLRPGGSVLAYDWFHRYEQMLDITESSADHPDGLTFHFRPFSWVRACFERHGFESVEFAPFVIPIDLTNTGADDDIYSRTTQDLDGRRHILRGTLLTPWCHFRAVKGSDG